MWKTPTSFVVATVLASCAAESAEEELSEVDSPILLVTASNEAYATGPWVNTPLPQVAQRAFRLEFHVEWRSGLSTEGSPTTAPIDAVFGLANGAADAFSDLGAIVRLNPHGYIDARDGSTYRADTAYSYLGRTPHVTMNVDLSTRRYSVVADGVSIATNYAFRTEQSTLSRMDTIAMKVDSARGWVGIDNVHFNPDHCSYAGQSWVTTHFPAQSGRFHAISYARVPQVTDAVVGLAPVQPLRFSDLAAIVRFRPDGTFDARDGGTYRAYTPVVYQPGQLYRIMFWVDVPAKRYSAFISRWDELGGTMIANEHAFRTEQAGATSLSKLGSFTDGAGYVQTCNLTVWNY